MEVIKATDATAETHQYRQAGACVPLVAVVRGVDEQVDEALVNARGFVAASAGQQARKQILIQNKLLTPTLELS